MLRWAVLEVSGRGGFVAHTPLSALHWPQIHLSSPEELELEPALKSFMCVYELPVVRT